MKKPLVVLTGPTAVGKTLASIGLAKAIGGEIISADSMQVYKHMDIGSAKIRQEEMEGVPHFLVDELEPWEEFHVVRFQQMAKAALENIYSRRHIPIVVGGTGFYINALLYDNDFTETENDTTFREECYTLAREKGPEALYEKLKQTDPEYAAEIHANNVKRVTRALEYHYLTGKKLSAHNAAQKRKESPYNAAVFLLTMERERLYRRIEERVDSMLSQGLAEEVRGLLERGYHPELVSMQGIGYKELVPYCKGECTLEEAVVQLKTNTRRFAKRQLTWFRRQIDGLWLDMDREDSGIMGQAISYLTELGVWKGEE